MNRHPTSPKVRIRRDGGALLALCVVALATVGCEGSAVAPARAEGDAARAAGVAIPTARLRVRAEPARRAVFETSARATGTVRAFHRATVTAETQGRVLVRSVEAGTAVEAGASLVELEASRFELALRHAEASLSAARTVLRHAERELGRGDRLIGRKAISSQQYDDLRLAVDRARDEQALAEVARDTARRDLSDARIESPFAGTVDSIAVDMGDFVTPGTPVAIVVDLSRVRLFSAVTAQEAARLSPTTSSTEQCRGISVAGAHSSSRASTRWPTRASSPSDRSSRATPGSSLASASPSPSNAARRAASGRRTSCCIERRSALWVAIG